MRSRSAWCRQCGRLSVMAALVSAALALWSVPAFAGEASDVEAKARELVTVQGNRRIDVATVRSYFHPTADGRFDEAARDAALKAGANIFLEKPMRLRRVIETMQRLLPP